EVLHERRHVAFVHRIGDGHRVGEKQPDRRRRQHDAGDRDERKEAEADPLILHQTRRTILPNWPEVSSRSCAAAASARGNVRSMAGRRRPAKNSAAARSSSPFVPMYEPRIVNCLANRACKSSVPAPPVVAPQVTRRPPRARDRTLLGQVASPTCSMTTSTPRLFVRRLTSSAMSCW